MLSSGTHLGGDDDAHRQRGLALLEDGLEHLPMAGVAEAVEGRLLDLLELGYDLNLLHAVPNDLAQDRSRDSHLRPDAQADDFLARLVFGESLDVSP